jgi:hypothetical protein
LAAGFFLDLAAGFFLLGTEISPPFHFGFIVARYFKERASHWPVFYFFFDHARSPP